MNIAIVKEDTNELIADITERDSVLAKGYKLLDYGNNSPIFQERNGKLFIVNNAFEMRLESD